MAREDEAESFGSRTTLEFVPASPPGIIGTRQLAVIKEIYFAMSEIRLFSVLVRCF
jgi:hypothetical protein